MATTFTTRIDDGLTDSRDTTLRIPIPYNSSAQNNAQLFQVPELVLHVACTYALLVYI